MQEVFNGIKYEYVDSKSYNNAILRLSSSSKVAKMSTLRYDIDKTKYKEVARINASLFVMATSQHLGWEYSDTFKTNDSSTFPDVIHFKDGTFLFGDIKPSQVDATQIEWAYSGQAIPLHNGIVLEEKDIITNDERRPYTLNSYSNTFSFLGVRADNSFIIGINYTKCNVRQIAQFCKSLGCTECIINDGGGSTEIILNGKIMNVTTERAISNALFMFESTEVNNTSNDLKKENEQLKATLRQVAQLTKGYL